MIGMNITDAAMQRYFEFNEAMFTNYDVYRLVVDGVKDLNYYDVTLPDGRLAYNVTTAEEKEALGHPNAGYFNYTNGMGFLAEDCWDFLKRRDIALYDYADANCTPEVLGGTPLFNPVWAGMTDSAKAIADIGTVVSENYQLFVTGQRKVEEWDDFVKSLYDLGLQSWIDECNAWYAQQ